MVGDGMGVLVGMGVEVGRGVGVASKEESVPHEQANVTTPAMTQSQDNPYFSYFFSLIHPLRV